MLLYSLLFLDLARATNGLCVGVKTSSSDRETAKQGPSTPTGRC